jgi:hypothetical protein
MLPAAGPCPLTTACPIITRAPTTVPRPPLAPRLRTSQTGTAASIGTATTRSSEPKRSVITLPARVYATSYATPVRERLKATGGFGMSMQRQPRGTGPNCRRISPFTCDERERERKRERCGSTRHVQETKTFTGVMQRGRHTSRPDFWDITFLSILIVSFFRK